VVVLRPQTLVTTAQLSLFLRLNKVFAANAGTELNSIDSSKVPEDQRVEEHEDKSFKKLVSYRALASEKVRIYPVDEENVEKVKEMYFLDHSLLKHENKVEEVQSYFATELGALETFIKKSRVTWGGDFELDDEVGNDLEKEEEIAPYDLSFGTLFWGGGKGGGTFQTDRTKQKKNN